MGRQRRSPLGARWSAGGTVRVIPREHLSQVSALVIAMLLAGCEQDSAGPVSGPSAPIPDLSGIWARNSMEFEEPASGPGPVMNRVRGARAMAYERAGDHTNPILKPAAAERVRQLGEIS